MPSLVAKTFLVALSSRLKFVEHKKPKHFTALLKSERVVSRCDMLLEHEAEMVGCNVPKPCSRITNKGKRK
jgi:hypothetical protein